MAFSMAGTRGAVRLRHLPRNVRGPSGYKGKQSPQVKVTRTHTVLPAARKQGKVTKAFGKVKAFFGRGNR